ncbi:MAG: response regulator [bacterium]
MASILVVDDQAQMLDVIRRMLSKVGHEITTASDGGEAIRLLTDGPLPDLVITDLIMPGQEGMETIMIIRERFPGVKIIAMSGGGQVSGLEYLPSASAMGAHQTLAKPFSTEALRTTVNAALADT